MQLRAAEDNDGIIGIAPPAPVAGLARSAPLALGRKARGHIE